MGCCQGNIMKVKKSRKWGKEQAAVESVTTVTQSSLAQHENQEFMDYIAQLKRQHGFERYLTMWFNTDEELQLDQQYHLQAQKYSLACTVTDLDPNLSRLFKFAIVLPEETKKCPQVKNLLFVYCKQSKHKHDQIAAPVVVRIVKTRANKKKGLFEFSADLNGIVKLALLLQLKEVSGQAIE